MRRLLLLFLKSNTLICLNVIISGLVQDDNGRDKIVMLQSNNIQHKINDSRCFKGVTIQENVYVKTISLTAIIKI